MTQLQRKSDILHRNALELPWSTRAFVAARNEVHDTGYKCVVHDHTILVVVVASPVTQVSMRRGNFDHNNTVYKS